MERSSSKLKLIRENLQEPLNEMVNLQYLLRTGEVVVRIEYTVEDFYKDFAQCKVCQMLQK